jgi:hypothetical protein
MFSSNTVRKMALCSLATMLCGAGQGAFAHTTIRDQATEGTNSYNAAVIGHTCTNPKNGAHLPVVAQSVLFPTVNPEVVRSDGVPTTLGDEFSIKDHTGTVTPLTSLAGKFTLIQNKNIFAKQAEITDAAGNAIGFYGKRGNLPAELMGLVPFRVSGITFAADKCAKSLKIKVAIADICKMTFPPRDGTANLWIPNTTGKFTDNAIVYDEGKTPGPKNGSPATLTINRKGELPESCGGVGYDVTVWPSNEDIDANLPFPGWR